MNEGYKMTELGEIPIEWSIKSVGEVCCKITDGEHQNPCTVINGVPLISAKDIKERDIDFSDVKYVSEEDFKKFTTKCNPEQGDILLVSRGATIGKSICIKSNRTFCLMGSVILVKLIKGLCEGRYFNNYIQTHIAQKLLLASSGSSAQQAIYLKDLSKIKMVLPSLEEQKLIADILSTFDEQIENTEVLIEKTKELKKGLMQRLLTKGINETEFKESVVGAIPKEWIVKTMKEIITKTQLGTNSIGSEKNNGIPLLKMGNLTLGGFDFSKVEKVKDDELKVNEEFLLKKGDFLFNTRNTLELVGKSATWDNQIEKAIFNSNIMRIYFNEDIDTFYMSYYFSGTFGWSELKKISTGTTSVAAIYTKDLYNVKVILPKIEEQQKIVSILREVDRQINQCVFQKEKLQQLKQGLMQKLLTGKIRVNV